MLLHLFSDTYDFLFFLGRRRGLFHMCCFVSDLVTGLD